MLNRRKFLQFTLPVILASGLLTSSVSWADSSPGAKPQASPAVPKVAISTTPHPAASVGTKAPTHVTTPKPSTSNITAAATAGTTVKQAQPNPNQKHLWNLQDADIGTVIDEVARETGKNFIVDPRVSGKITIISDGPMDAKELFQVFLASLAVQNFAAVPIGHNTIKILPAQDAQGLTPEEKISRFGESGEVVVRVVPLKNVSAQQLAPILRPLLPSWAIVSAYAPTNVLILSGNAPNVNNVVNIAHKVDVTNEQNFQVIHLKQATAKDMVNTLNSLFSATRTDGEPQMISLAADSRTNSIILSGDLTQRMRAGVLIAELDVKNPLDSNSNVSIVHLKYLNALKFAPILAQVAQASMALSSGKPVPTSGGSGSTTTSNISSSSSSSSLSSSSSGGSDAVASTAPVDDSAAYSSPMIQPEINSNALIITAPHALMKTLRSVISQLDVRPSQILVEAAIVELSTEDLEKLGVQFGSVPSTVQTDTNGQQQSITGFQNFTGIIQNGSWQIILSALDSDTDVNVLSTPSVMVTNNHQALIAVGKQVSVQNGSYVTPGGGGSDNPYNTTTQKGFDLSLAVTPQVTQKLVQMAVDQKDDRLTDPDNPGLNPESNDSEIKTNVIVNSGDILVLGGLIDDNNTQGLEKLPLLGDIPLLGHLFQYQNNAHDKKNMVVFLHPVIINSEEESNSVSGARYNFVRNLQLAWNQEHKDVGGTVLPGWEEQVQLPPPFKDE